MTQQPNVSTRWKTSYTLILGLTACLAVVACSMWQRNAPVTESARNDKAVEQTHGAAKNESASAPRTPAPSPKAEESIPLTEESIAALRVKIKGEQDYAARLETRRTLLHALRKGKQLDRAMNELESLLTDVQNEEGLDMAQRVALAEANTLELQKDFTAAVRAYELLAHRYKGGRFTAEAMLHQGNCLLELHDYIAAEQVWLRLVEEHVTSPEASWGWRKIALAQLLQGKFDDSLATLTTMEKIYADGEFGEYARMRRGYVLMQAKRLPEARLAYTSFLSACPTSKYCQLVQQQMTELDTTGKVAKARK